MKGPELLSLRQELRQEWGARTESPEVGVGEEGGKESPDCSDPDWEVK